MIEAGWQMVCLLSRVSWVKSYFLIMNGVKVTPPTEDDGSIKEVSTIPNFQPHAALVLPSPVPPRTSCGQGQTCTRTVAAKRVAEIPTQFLRSNGMSAQRSRAAAHEKKKALLSCLCKKKQDNGRSCCRTHSRRAKIAKTSGGSSERASP